MNRRKTLQVCAGLGAVGFAPLMAAGKPNTASDALSDFAKRWAVAIDYTLKVFEAMPEEHLDYRPTPEVMSFGKHFTHIGWGNALYTKGLTGQDIPKEPDELTKENILAYFNQTTEAFITAMNAQTPATLFSRDHHFKEQNYWKDHSHMDMLWRGYMHTTHHRAQAIVYLRLKGVEPPGFLY